MSRDPEDPVNDGAGAEPGPSGDTGRRDRPEEDAFPAEVAAALAGLSARLDREHERAAHREAVIDRLHEENQRLRRGELLGMLEPVRAALFRLHDEANRAAERLSRPGDPPDPAQTARLLTAVADEIADALARIGVERFTAEPGDPYDAARHRPVEAAAVTDPGLADTVVTVRADGFEQDGRVLRKAEVAVGRFGGGADGTTNRALNSGLGTDR
ncbi:nucleotide exchange factor GrpE [Spirillospora albida]|uniref:nucleotide exchange factor GrpE n=1 Tax=Spirillospora albida TaxID=58123 RepID=UPI0004C0E195|nr:nucleotide exchange factor GrpE [Spirillospora albida]